MPSYEKPETDNLLSRNSSDSEDLPLYSNNNGNTYNKRGRKRWSIIALARSACLASRLTHAVLRRGRHFVPGLSERPRASWPRVRLAWKILFIVVGSILAFSVVRAILQPSYQNPPQHYHDLREAVTASSQPGRGNPRNEKVFIAANIVEQDLIRGPWGTSVLELIELLGPENVFLSIYENDSGSGTISALRDLKSRAPCVLNSVPVLHTCPTDMITGNSSIVTGDHLGLESFPRITHPSGSTHVKRISYLAEVRNRALRPLDLKYTPPTTPPYNGFSHAATPYDRVLFLNDVFFNPIDALHLLFSTNLDPTTQRANYLAACGVDFHRYAMFYDIFATRDLDGFQTGYMVYPFFAPVGSQRSRNDVLAGKDAVRVSSCWSGIAAFDARPFQPAGRLPAAPSPVKFRGETEPFIESSECCLVHADIGNKFAKSINPAFDGEKDKGVYMNPYVRVAYKPVGFSWIPFVTRYEHFFIPIQWLFSNIAYPAWNPRRLDKAGEEVKRKVWRYDDETDGETKRGKGSYREEVVTAKPGGFCAENRLFVMLDMKADTNQGGERNWEKVFDIPSGGFS